jgi:hypothetical protein
MRDAFPPQGAPVLNCPGCGNKVADGAAICPSCDYIIDASFISTDAPQESDAEQAPASRPARGTGARPAARAAPGSGARSRPAAPAVVNEDATNIKSMDEVMRNAPPRPAPGKSNPSARPVAPRAGGSGARTAAPTPRRAQEAERAPADDDYASAYDNDAGSGLIAAPEDVFEEFRQFVGIMGISDKVALGGVGMIVLSAVFPWKETAADGDILGLMSLGLVCVLASLAILGTITVRVRRLLPDLNVLIPWLGQLALSIFCVIWCIVFMKISTDASAVPSLMGDATVMNSSPSMGAYMGLLGSLTCLAGTLLGLKEKPAS